jgi:predicted RNA-binding protein
MDTLPEEIIQYIGTYLKELDLYKCLNKNFYNYIQKDHFKLICKKNISKVLLSKQKIIDNNDIYNRYEKLSSGIYKILSSNYRHHLFIRIDIKSSMIEENFDQALLYINGSLTPGNIFFECF